jgi:rhodanese-related sulfurtransferase
MAVRTIFEDVEEAKKIIQNLSVKDVQTEIDSGGDLLLVDLRELQERVELGTIPESVHVPRGMLEFWADPASPYYRDYFQETRRTIVFCAGGARSALATRALLDMGFTDVAHLEPGFGGWQKDGAAIQDIASTSRWVRR